MKRKNSRLNSRSRWKSYFLLPRKARVERPAEGQRGGVTAGEKFPARRDGTRTAASSAVAVARSLRQDQREKIRVIENSALFSSPADGEETQRRNIIIVGGAANCASSIVPGPSGSPGSGGICQRLSARNFPVSGTSECRSITFIYMILFYSVSLPFDSTSFTQSDIVRLLFPFDAGNASRNVGLRSRLLEVKWR